jgi:hypothetical protein
MRRVSIVFQYYAWSKARLNVLDVLLRLSRNRRCFLRMREVAHPARKHAHNNPLQNNQHQILPQKRISSEQHHREKFTVLCQREFHIRFGGSGIHTLAKRNETPSSHH